MKSTSKLLLSGIVGFSAYLIANKFSSEERIKSFDEDPLIGLRGDGGLTKIFPKIFKKVSRDRALKIGLLALFGTTAVLYFPQIEALLIDDAFDYFCVSRDLEGNLKIGCGISEEPVLLLHTDEMRELISDDILFDRHKIFLLKTKIDIIANGECMERSRFLVMAIMVVILTFTISNVGGLALILESLRALLREKKISKALYKQIIKAIVKRWGKNAVPVEYLPE